jgi:hypothetical protein
MKNLVAKIEQVDSVTELCKEINVLDAVHWISESWKETRIETVSKYFKLSRFPIWSEVKSTYDADDDISLIQLAKINSLKLELLSAICPTKLVTSSLFLIITYE